MIPQHECWPENEIWDLLLQNTDLNPNKAGNKFDFWLYLCHPSYPPILLPHQTQNLYSVSDLFSVSSGPQSSWEALCKLPVITTVSLNSVGERKKRETVVWRLKGKVINERLWTECRKKKRTFNSISSHLSGVCALVRAELRCTRGIYWWITFLKMPCSVVWLRIILQKWDSIKKLLKSSSCGSRVE